MEILFLLLKGDERHAHKMTFYIGKYFMYLDKSKKLATCDIDTAERNSRVIGMLKQ